MSEIASNKALESAKKDQGIKIVQTPQWFKNAFYDYYFTIGRTMGTDQELLDKLAAICGQTVRSTISLSTDPM